MLQNLKKLREAASVSQKQLAEAIGVSQQSINKYENHKIEPDIGTMIKIADYFETSVDYLIGHSAVRRKIEETEECALNAQELQLVYQYRQLNAKQREGVQSVIAAFQP